VARDVEHPPTLGVEVVLVNVNPNHAGAFCFPTAGGFGALARVRGGGATAFACGFLFKISRQSEMA
jgi:hypothetical protein